jgi:hypothetical protein
MDTVDWPPRKIWLKRYHVQCGDRDNPADPAREKPHDGFRCRADLAAGHRRDCADAEKQITFA